MNTKNQLLASVSALALIIGTSACDRTEDNTENTVVVLPQDEANDVAAEREDARNANLADNEKAR